MSLDIWLYLKKEHNINPLKSSGIFIRQDGQTKEISREEWDSLYPNQEPFVFSPKQDDESNEVCVYSSNITHNLGAMAREVGLYVYLWRPEEVNLTLAKNLIQPLTEGLKRLKENPEEFKKFNPENGWGTYEGLVSFTENYLDACKQYPEAVIHVSR